MRAWFVAPIATVRGKKSTQQKTPGWQSRGLFREGVRGVFFHRFVYEKEVILLHNSSMVSTRGRIGISFLLMVLIVPDACEREMIEL